MKRPTVLIAAAALAAAGCTTDGARLTGSATGATRLILTNATPGPAGLTGLELFVTRVEVATASDSNAPFTSVAEPGRRYDLLALLGSTEVLGGTDVHFGSVALVRLTIDLAQSRAVWAPESEAELLWSGSGTVTALARVEQPLVTWASDVGDIVLEFDVDLGTQSVLDGGPGPRWVFAPVMRAINAQASARIAGTVSGQAEGSDAVVPAPYAVVRALRVRGDEEPLVIGGGAVADAAGHYALPHLDAGTYLLQASPPDGFGTVSGLSEGTITVLMGDDRTVDLLLGVGIVDTTGATPGLGIAGPTTIGLDDTVTVSATVVTEGGDSVPSPAVQWTSRNPAVMTVIGQGPAVEITGKALGTAWLVAAWETLLDSALISVVSSTDTTGGGGGGGGAVATVTVLPATATVSVGDSLGFFAELRDADGVALTGRTVTWTVSNLSVVEIYGAFGPTLIVRALASGTATVTATSEGKSGSATVTVN